MAEDIECTWFICTISKEGFKNWEICKSVSAWGILRSGNRWPNLHQIKRGDHLIIYAASKGFIATAIVTGPMKRPSSSSDIPWNGGIYKYGGLVPFKIIAELKIPIKATFTKMTVDGTKIHTSRLQKGFSTISGTDGNYLYREILARGQ